MHGKAAHTPRPDPGENPERGKVRSKPGMGRRATATVVVPVPRPKPGKTPVRSRGHDERAMAATKMCAAQARAATRRGTVDSVPKGGVEDRDQGVAVQEVDHGTAVPTSSPGWHQPTTQSAARSGYTGASRKTGHRGLTGADAWGAAQASWTSPGSPAQQRSDRAAAAPSAATRELWADAALAVLPWAALSTCRGHGRRPRTAAPPLRRSERASAWA